MKKVKKFFSIIGLILLAIIVAGFCYFFVGKAKPVEKVDFGVTFSKIQAEDLGLDWQKTYLAILDDLKVKKVRLIAYWSEIEPTEGIFDFKDLDWQIDEAQKRGAEIILAVGRRLPRWPECHIPQWAKIYKEKQQQEKILNMISETIKRYRTVDAIEFWQIENEPFLMVFGQCPGLDREFLSREIALVKSLDARKIILTESGEFSTWIGAARRTDILGTSLYRIIYGRFGFYVHYPMPAIFYSRKVALIKKIFNVEKIIVIELQAEPWGPKQNWDLPLEEQFKSMDLDKFRKSIDYVKQVGFSEAYLWGAEWWYWMKEKNSDNKIWEEARKLF